MQTRQTETKKSEITLSERIQKPNDASAIAEAHGKTLTNVLQATMDTQFMKDLLNRKSEALISPENLLKLAQKPGAYFINSKEEKWERIPDNRIGKMFEEHERHEIIVVDKSAFIRANESQPLRIVVSYPAMPIEMGECSPWFEINGRYFDNVPTAKVAMSRKKSKHVDLRQ